MKTLRFVLGDQLHRRIASLVDIDPDHDVVLMAEVRDEATYVRHHKQKIAFLFSAMRHFAAELMEEGIAVDYVRLDDRANSGSFTGELKRAIERHEPDRIVVTEPGEWRVWQMMQDWREDLSPPVEIREDNRFLCSRAEFEAWAGDRKSLLMEAFYRQMRRRTGWLMDGKEPTGGQWNYDPENRKRLPKTIAPPERMTFPPDAITRDCIALAAQEFSGHFGSLDAFAWPVTRKEALKAFRRFIRDGLPTFGDYQDAMRQGSPFLYHALISPMLNAGLLTPEEVCEAAVRAFREGDAPLNCVEGFIRQILGWREYVRGLYWARMPGYADTNALDASRDLPWFYWSAETQMNCLHQCISETRDHAYAHHIQRLMVLGNFALLAGVEPRQVEEWYLIVYADAYDWVELPNVHGMVLWADGGVMGSKPYAASGAYIDRMSDYCGRCAYDVRRKAGEKACPFNYLYWDFLLRNAGRLERNPRLAMPYRTLGRMGDRRRAEIRGDAHRFLRSLDPNPSKASGDVEASEAVRAAPTSQRKRTGRADASRSRRSTLRTTET
ncbi:cryptochrome/photolyase family protein [Methylobacterium gnaphalii]|uniref:Deoxyribodipyrimidine photo-lyase n=1 Tax=Methylobacterium gnaphalii TaxID=1010610 RepID=A0A512JJF4_9HYPH|nr:cryptochrome/photolyase family protein [Methylobacterium gnaphalii]GEP10002.1 deoxyribodipyrimidine photo-lyase [Methylobacterium gnaphalii]GJD68995.1 (6-4) photolyase [Methylobacterium gnaphalii]GLS48272.1 deoxyribodipyrimidine photo-lyase [Methylobacterium gnaphalii]